MSIQSVEDQIKAEWGIIRATVALHPYITLAVIIVLAYFAGALLKGWPF